jgi:hypothetical protein
LAECWGVVGVQASSAGRGVGRERGAETTVDAGTVATLTLDVSVLFGREYRDMAYFTHGRNLGSLSTGCRALGGDLASQR